MKALIDRIITAIMIPALWVFERYFMYRIREAWGSVHLMNIKNKGSNNRIVGYSRFLDTDNLYIGSGVEIGYGCFFFCKGGIHIGDHTIISRNVTIYSANHNYRGDVVPFDDQYVSKPVKIGKAVWIGMHAQILPGVTIGDGAIVGMGTVVRQDVEPGSVVGSAPCHVMTKRDMSRFSRALEEGDTFSQRYRSGA